MYFHLRHLAVKARCPVKKKIHNNEEKYPLRKYFINKEKISRPVERKARTDDTAGMKAELGAPVKGVGFDPMIFG